VKVTVFYESLLQFEHQDVFHIMSIKLFFVELLSFN